MHLYSDLDGIAWPDPEEYGFEKVKRLGISLQQLHDSLWWESKVIRDPKSEYYAMRVAEDFGLQYTPQQHKEK